MAKKNLSTFRFLWVTDPWSTLDHTKDTTIRLAQEAALLGYGSYWCDVKSVRFDERRTWVEAAPIGGAPVSTEQAPANPPSPLQSMDITSFSSIHYRVDPPVDLAYLHPLQLLSLGIWTASQTKARIVNHPRTLFCHNEKTEAAFLGKLMPETLIASQWEPLRNFVQKHRRAVLKPLHEAQSKGVELLHWKGSSEEEWIRKLLTAATHDFQSPVLVQKFLPGIAEGEQRLWFLDGKLLATVRKLPLKNDFRVNIDGGSGLQKTFLNAREKDAAKRIGKYLKSSKIRLAAVDLIDGLITDFNFTSPGLITQMEKVLDQNLARPIITALAARSV